MKKSRVIIACFIFLLLAVCAYPSDVTAQPVERREERNYEIYDDSGIWYGRFSVTLRVSDPIRDRRDANFRGEFYLHEITFNTDEVIINGIQWEVKTDDGRSFIDKDTDDRVLDRPGMRHERDVDVNIPDDFEGRADFQFTFFYDVVSEGHHMVSDYGESWVDNVRIERNQPIPPEFLPFIIILIVIVALALVVRRKRKTPSVETTTPAMTAPLTSPTIPVATTPIAATETQFIPDLISVKRGYETAGQYLKVGVKVENNAPTSITDVSVKIDVPAALEKINPKTGIIELGVIKPGGAQSANFQLQPIRCVDDVITGIVMLYDASGKLHTQEMKALEIKSVCPMLTGEDVDTEWILMSLKKGKIKTNKAHFKFDGDPKVAFAMAESRVRGLIPIDRDEKFVNEHYIAYASYIGRTKYGEFDFATEITVTGHYAQGLLTIAVYSNEESILSGFFYEVLQDVKKNVEITKETVHIAEQTCPECGGSLDMNIADEEGYIKCSFCETMLRVPKWKR